MTAYYEFSLEDEAIIQAVQSKYFDWLKFVWAFGKNFTGSRRQGDAVKITIKALLAIVSHVYTNDPIRAEECCDKVCKWMMLGDEAEHNVLWALLAEN